MPILVYFLLKLSSDLLNRIPTKWYCYKGIASDDIGDGYLINNKAFSKYCETFASRSTRSKLEVNI